jgi:hypothetical protein
VINSQKHLLYGDDNLKRRAIHSAFCSRDQLAEARNAITCALTNFVLTDQLAEARNAITCALTYFVLTSIAIRHAARETIRGSRNLLERPLADDVSCSRDQSQNVLATVRVVVLHNHVFSFPIALSARATTRRRRLLEKLADPSSQTGACGRQHCDNDNSQLLCAAKDETSVEFMGRMFCCNFLRKSRL